MDISFGCKLRTYKYTLLRLIFYYKLIYRFVSVQVNQKITCNICLVIGWMEASGCNENNVKGGNKALSWANGSTNIAQDEPPALNVKRFKSMLQDSPATAYSALKNNRKNPPNPSQYDNGNNFQGSNCS